MKKKVYTFSFIFFVIDLISKILVLNLDKNYEIIPNFFSIYFVKNKGVAFSLLEGYTLVIILISIGVLYYLYKYVLINIKKREIIPYSLIIGGILGNLVDRIFRGYVIDFLSFKIFNMNFAIFNLADSFICIGALILIIDLIRGEKYENSIRKK